VLWTNFATGKIRVDNVSSQLPSKVKMLAGGGGYGYLVGLMFLVSVGAGGNSSGAM